jgi:hypothetical protein
MHAEQKSAKISFALLRLSALSILPYENILSG